MLSAQSPEAPEQGASHQIDGTVHDALEEPVPGARVRLLDDFRGAALAETRSDGEGRFLFRRTGFAPARQLWVEASAAGLHTTQVPTGPWLEGRARARAVLRLFPAVTVAGRIVDADDAPVPGAHVTVAHTETSLFEALPLDVVADEEGRFRIEGACLGDSWIRAWAPGHVMVERRLTLDDDVEAELPLVRGEGRRARVVLTSASATQLAGASWQFTPLRDGLIELYPRPLREGGFPASGEVDLVGLPAGRYRAFGRLDVPGAFADFTRTGRNFDPPILRGEVVPLRRFQIRGALRLGGHPVPDATLRFGTHVPDTVRTARDGTFTARIALPADLTRDLCVVRLLDGPCLLASEGPGGGSELSHPRRAFLTLEPERPLLLEGTPGGRARGRVLRPDGSPAQDASVRVVLRAPPNAWEFARGATDRDGTFFLDGVPFPDQPARLEARAPGLYGHALANLFDRDADESPHDLKLIRTATLEGTVRGPDGAPRAGALLTVSAPFHDDRSTLTDRAGRYRWVDLPPGEYRLTLFDRDERGPRVELPRVELRSGARTRVDLPKEGERPPPPRRRDPD